MDSEQFRRKFRALWVMISLAIAYSGLLYFLHTLTGSHVLDGIIGMLLGLYISAQPAANMVDTIFYERSTFRQLSGEWSGVRWLALNGFALVAGWVILVIGIIRVIGKN